MKFIRSKRLFSKAKKTMPGGVSSPVRSFNAVGGSPLFINNGFGSKLTDADNNQYIDFVNSWGAMILGHANPDVISAIIKTSKKGTSFGAPTESEVNLSREICRALPSIEMIRFVNSGTEATMSAIRLARGYTGRDLVVKFEGCYHGHVDSLLANAGSGLTTFKISGSSGTGRYQNKNTLTLPYNNLEIVKKTMAKYGKRIAAIIVEPIAANMGVIPPTEGFLKGLRDIANSTKAILIFDEVITGFRVAYGGAQTLYGVSPDITCLGKIIGGGLPVGAFGGRERIMRLISPLGPVYQAGTLSGNPIAMTAGEETLRILKRPGVYKRLENASSQLAEGLYKAAIKANVSLHINRVGSILTTFFKEGNVIDFRSSNLSDTKQFSTYFQLMLRNGIYLPPSQFEAMFVSLAHDNKDITTTITTAESCFSLMSQ